MTNVLTHVLTFNAKDYRQSIILCKRCGTGILVGRSAKIRHCPICNGNLKDNHQPYHIIKIDPATEEEYTETRYDPETDKDVTFAPHFDPDWNHVDTTKHF